MKAREEYPPISKLNEFNFMGKALGEGKQSISPVYDSQDSTHLQNAPNPKIAHH